jgi:hypothetical protein
MGTLKKTQVVNCLKKAPWLQNGPYKGLYHDRQHLGIILAKGKKINVRQINNMFNGELILRLYNNNSKTESSIKFSDKVVSMTAQETSVVFIDTPYVDGDSIHIKPIVEMEYPDSSKPLPVYNQGGNEDDFFNDWSKYNAEYSLLESPYVIFLVPMQYKSALRNLDEGTKKINDLFHHYEDIITFNNSLTGLSFHPENPTDQNISNRFFFKVNKHHIGLAWFGKEYIDTGVDDMRYTFLTTDMYNETNLHELGHGYEISYIRDSEEHTSFVEVWNRIFVSAYQQVRLGEEVYKKGWLYGGSQEKLEKKITGYLEKKHPLAYWDQREKTYFLMVLIQRAGMESFTDFYRKNRIDKGVKSYFPSEIQEVMDMMSWCFTQNATQVNVTPFILLAGGHLSTFQCEINLFSQAYAVYPANQFIQGDKLKSLRKALSLDGDLSLVSVQELKSTGLTGNVSLDLKNFWDFDRQFKNKELKIMDGPDCIRKVLITDKKIDIKDLPIGVYSLRVPTGRSEKRDAKLNYLVVKPGFNLIDFPVRNIWHSRIGGQRIDLIGLDEMLFAAVIINQDEQQIEIGVFSTQPHFRYGSEEYARIVFKDNNGKEVLRKSIPGKGAVLSHDTFSFNNNSTLEIYHAEHEHRIQLVPEFDGVLDQKTATNTFLMTYNGLKNVITQNDPFLFQEWAINNAAVLLRGNPEELYSDYAPVKAHIWLAIKRFPSPKREELLKKYADCIPSDNG